MSGQPLAPVGSLKVKLGVLVGASVVVAALVGTLGRAGGVSPWLSIPVTILLALAVTQLLAVGMTSPLREMTAAAKRMARGDYSVRVSETSHDEVGELARAFNRTARDLATVDRQRRELVANVSHELRTPLAALQAVLENLVDGSEPADPDALRPALAQAERLGTLVTDLLDLARVDAGKAPLTPQPVAVAALLVEAVEEAQVSGRPVQYDVLVDPPDLVVRADPARLRQLVANLLDNASRHSPTGGSVRVTVTRIDDRHRIEVSDQGPGVALLDRDRAFEPFGTLSATEGGGGTGLGLAIARWVTDLHGGSIAFVEPESGSTGARVRVDLPAAPPVRPAPTEETLMSTPAPPPAPAAVVPPPVTDGLLGPFWPDRGEAGRPALLLAVLGVGLLAALVLPYRDAGVGTFVVLVAGGVVIMAASKNRTEPFTRACAGICLLLAGASVIRDADWIIFLSVFTGAIVTVCGVTGARTMPGFALSALSGPLAGLRGLPWLGRSLGAMTGHGNSAAVLRTAVWSATGLLVFGLLFASADALFAEWADAIVPDLNMESFVLRAFILVAVGGVVLAAAYLGLNPPRVDQPQEEVRPVSRPFEWLAPVLVVDGVFAAFLVAQATVIFGGHDYLERTTGLTYADYVHEGFGQMTVATALTLLVIWAAARKAPRATPKDRLWVRAALGLLCVQTLVVVASALHRMHVYQEAYGFTELRLLVDVFEGWLGLLVLAVMVAGLTLKKAVWLPRFALLTGAGLIVALATINPDAWIAQRNVDRYEETGKLDWSYLQGLSDDAVPVLRTLPEEVQPCVLAGHQRADDDWLEWNLGRWRAHDDLVRIDAPAQAPSGCPDSR